MSGALLDASPVATEDDENEWLIALFLVLLIVDANAYRPLTATQRRRARDLLRVRFEDAALRNAQRVIANLLSVDEWQAAVSQEIASYARQMAVAGAGTMPSAAVRQFAEVQVAEQMPFLDGFGVAVAAGMLTLAQIASRTRLYGGVGWASYFMSQGESAPLYAVEQWISRDDRGTCFVCAQRSGRYFLPGQGPMPGTDCRGGGNCRCERRQVIDREIWQRLTGRVA